MARQSSFAHRRFWSLSGSPVLVFRFVLAGIMLSTGVGVTYALVNRSAFHTSFPGAATLGVYVAFLIVGATGFVALVGLWYWRRWATVLYGVLAVATVLLDAVARAPLAHEVAVVVGAVTVFTLVYLNRERFRPRGPTGAV